MDNLGELIKAKRQKQDISAQQLADYIGVKVFNVYKWENGSKPSDPDVYQKLKDWLNLESGIKKVDTKEAELLTVLIELMKKQNHILDRQTKNVEERVEVINANLNSTLAGVTSLALQAHSSREVALRSLARLEKIPEETLLQEADKIIQDRMEALAPVHKASK